jgi:hypothetical protein
MYPVMPLCPHGERHSTSRAAVPLRRDGMIPLYCRFLCRKNNFLCFDSGLRSLMTRRDTAEIGVRKRFYQAVIQHPVFPELNIVNLSSEKVYVSGLVSLWPEITRIPN